MHTLQQTIGNQAALRLLAQRASSCAGNEPHGHNERELAQHFGNLSVFPSAATTPRHQEIQLPRPIYAPDGAATPELRRIASSLGSGKPLYTSSRDALQPLTHLPLDAVRVHDDPHAAVTAAILSADAFTIGNHIVLGNNDQIPGGRRWLLAHEVAHTVQQHPSNRFAVGRDTERDANTFADQAVFSPSRQTALLASQPEGLARAVIAKQTLDLPGDLLLVIDIDDGDFVGGCVKAIAPHLGIKLVMKGVPRGAPGGNQLFNIHLGFLTNAAGEACLFFYESVSGICEMKCFESEAERDKSWEEIKDWLKEMLKKLLRALAITALIIIGAILIDLIVDAIIAALAVLAAAVAALAAAAAALAAVFA